MKPSLARYAKFALLACTIVYLAACNGSRHSAVLSDNSRSHAPLVEIGSGQVQGKAEQGIFIFKGIPYAAPPTDNNRWRAPQAVANWTGIFDASDFNHDCMQLPFPSDAAPLGETPAEDCLYLNVWQPATASQKLPVVIWIYGGGYVNGGASPATYDGSEFAKKGVIFVSFNYRLGRFGFFAHPALTAADEGPLANYAFMDQMTALKWVHQNIAAFNGDPDNVTIMGESAGGGSVHNLMQSPSVRGLFQRAIIMSGGGRSLMGERSLKQGDRQHPSAQQIGLNFAQSKGIEGADEKALSALRALAPEQVVDGLNLASLFSSGQDKPTYVGGPVTEGDIVRGSTENMLKQGQVAKIPVMVGTTSQDIGFNQARSKTALFAGFGEAAKQAELAYDPKGNLPLPLLAFQVGQDRTMQEPARFVAQQMTRLGQPVFLYRFSYVNEAIRDGQGAQHASDIPFFFNTIEQKYSQLTAQDKKMAATILSYLVNFIKQGDPNAAGLTQWQPFVTGQDNLMDFTLDGTAVHKVDPWKARLDAVQASVDGR